MTKPLNIDLIHTWIRGCVAESQQMLSMVDQLLDTCTDTAADVHLAQLRSHALSIAGALTDIEGIAYELRAIELEKSQPYTCLDTVAVSHQETERDTL